MPLLNFQPKTEAIVAESIARFTGQATTLESALGALIVGQHYGWRVLKMLHNPSTYRKYEKILGIRFEDVCHERTQLTRKSVGMQIADKLQSFWAVARGKKRVPDKGMLIEG